MPTLNLSVLCSPGFEPALISRIAVYGPVCTVVWEGGAVRLLPIPMDVIWHHQRGGSSPSPGHLKLAQRLLQSWRECVGGR